MLGPGSGPVLSSPVWTRQPGDRPQPISGARAGSNRLLGRKAVGLRGEGLSLHRVTLWENNTNTWMWFCSDDPF